MLISKKQKGILDNAVIEISKAQRIQDTKSILEAVVKLTKNEYSSSDPAPEIYSLNEFNINDYYKSYEDNTFVIFENNLAKKNFDFIKENINLVEEEEKNTIVLDGLNISYGYTDITDVLNKKDGPVEKEDFMYLAKNQRSFYENQIDFFKNIWPYFSETTNELLKRTINKYNKIVKNLKNKLGRLEEISEMQQKNNEIAANTIEKLIEQNKGLCMKNKILKVKIDTQQNKISNLSKKLDQTKQELFFKEKELGSNLNVVLGETKKETPVYSNVEENYSFSSTENKVESQEEPKVESQEESKVDEGFFFKFFSKEESQEEPKVESQEESKEESKEEPKEESKVESQEESKEESQEESQVEPQVDCSGEEAAYSLDFKTFFSKIFQNNVQIGAFSEEEYKGMSNILDDGSLLVYQNFFEKFPKEIRDSAYTLINDGALLAFDHVEARHPVFNTFITSLLTGGATVLSKYINCDLDVLAEGVSTCINNPTYLDSIVTLLTVNEETNMSPLRALHNIKSLPGSVKKDLLNNLVEIEQNNVSLLKKHYDSIEEKPAFIKHKYYFLDDLVTVRRSGLYCLNQYIEDDKHAKFYTSLSDLGKKTKGLYESQNMLANVLEVRIEQAGPNLNCNFSDKVFKFRSSRKVVI